MFFLNFSKFCCPDRASDKIADHEPPPAPPPPSSPPHFTTDIKCIGQEFIHEMSSRYFHLISSLMVSDLKKLIQLKNYEVVKILIEKN